MPRSILLSAIAAARRTGWSPLRARAQKVELRESDDSLLQEITLEPKRPVALRAGRPHLALRGITQPLVAGDAFPLTLRFAGAGSIEVTVMVEAAPAH